MFWICVAILAVWISVSLAAKKKSVKKEASFSFGNSRSNNKLQGDSSKVWKNTGETVLIGQHKIKYELLYIGTELSSLVSEYTAEPALINGNLKLENSEGKELPDLGYWPSYTELLPIQRDAYLSWLAGGRSNPKANIGFVFLFFYGLERRALVELGSTGNNIERTQIVTEVKRLRDIYSSNKSFNSYSFNFLQALLVINNNEKFYRSPAIKKKTGYEMPITTQAALGQLVADRLPIPAEWAYAWVVTSPNYFPKTPASRCPLEHENLFKLKYSEKFGDGLVVKPGKSLLKFEYKAATRSFTSASIDCLDLPDVLAGKTNLNKLTALSDACCEELDEYSRYLGRKNSDPSSIHAKSLLPAALVNHELGDAIQKLKLFIENNFVRGETSRTISTKDLAVHWPSSPALLSRSDTIALGGILEKWGYGIEPDPRLKSSTLEKSSHCVLFQLGNDKVSSAITTQYKMALFFLRLAALISGSSTTADAKQDELVFSYLKDWVHLTPAELKRAKNHYIWLKTSEVKITGFKKEIEVMNLEQRSAVKQFLIAIAAYDGHIEPREVTSLTKAYKLLSFEESDLFSELHMVSLKESDEPVKIASVSKIKSFSIPVPAVQNVSNVETFNLDVDVIAKKLKESSKAFKILNDVFENEIDEIDELKQAEKNSSELDRNHLKFLKALLAKVHWERHEIEELAKSMGLLADGALEIINDFAFDKYDQPAWEGQDPIEINLDIFKLEVA